MNAEGLSIRGIEQLNPAEKFRRVEILMRRLMPERHAQSVVAARIEKRLDRLNDSAFDSGQLADAADMDELSPGAVSNIENIQEWYLRTAENRAVQEQKLQQHLHSTEPTVLGAGVFRYVRERQKATAVDPKANVYFLSHPLAFILLVEGEQDYNDISYWKEKSRGEYSKDSKLGGKAVDWSGNEYEHVPLAIVRYQGQTRPKRRELTRLVRNNHTVAHELAHAFQHTALDLFKTTESSWNKYLSAEDQANSVFHQGIKDEVLAFFKGSRADFSTIADEASVYRRLFVGMSPAAQASAREIVRSIEKVVQQLDSRLSYVATQTEHSQEIRRVLYYQLLDVPLSLLPTYLKTQLAFYESVRKTMYMPGIVSGLPNFPPDAYLGSRQKQYQRLMRARATYEQQADKTARPVFDTPRVVTARELEHWRTEVEQAAAELWTPSIQYRPTYATDIRFLPSESEPKGRPALDEVLNLTQAIESKYINSQFLRLATGADVVGEEPGQDQFFNTIKRQLVHQGLILDQVVVDECDVRGGMFCVALRLTLPSEPKQPAHRVKARLNFIVDPDIRDEIRIAASS